jgi:hypothetical protein
MTRRSDPPVVLVKWYDFTKWVLGHVDNFPKNQRFVFGQRLADGVLAILELIVDATYSDKKSKILLEVIVPFNLPRPFSPQRIHVSPGFGVGAIRIKSGDSDP